MNATSAEIVNKKFLIAMVLVCLAIGGSFALVYLDLKADLESLRYNYQTLLLQMQQLQYLLESSQHNQTLGLTAVQIYNQTKHSVVLIRCTLLNASAVEGSGFIYDAAGHIVTNNHVIEGAAEIKVTFFDGRTILAQLKGGDVYSDLAVVKVNPNSLPEQAHPLIIGDSTMLVVGEPVYAIGNPLHQSFSMTAGIVSQVGRVIRLSEFGIPPPRGQYSYVDVIQFDAAVNPGNSGGPLFNSLGFVVGVTFAIETVSNITAFIGIGYAIPSVLIKRVIPSIIETGRYVHPWMGIGCSPDYVGGALVTFVNDTGPSAGRLTAGDIIIKIDDLDVNRFEDLLIYLERYKSPRDIVNLKVVRDGNFSNPLDISLTLGERP